MYIYIHVHISAPGRRTGYRPRGPPPGPREAMALLECRVVHDEVLVRARPDAEQQISIYIYIYIYIERERERCIHICTHIDVQPIRTARRA